MHWIVALLFFLGVPFIWLVIFPAAAKGIQNDNEEGMDGIVLVDGVPGTRRDHNYASLYIVCVIASVILFVACIIAAISG